MTKIIGIKRYNTETSTIIAEKDHLSECGNYSSTTRLM